MSLAGSSGSVWRRRLVKRSSGLRASPSDGARFPTVPGVSRLGSVGSVRWPSAVQPQRRQTLDPAAKPEGRPTSPFSPSGTERGETVDRFQLVPGGAVRRSHRAARSTSARTAPFLTQPLILHPDPRPRFTWHKAGDAVGCAHDRRCRRWASGTSITTRTARAATVTGPGSGSPGSARQPWRDRAAAVGARPSTAAPGPLRCRRTAPSRPAACTGRCTG